MEKKIPKDKNSHCELERQGWMRRFVADEPRLSEAAELYRSLGYDVKLEPAILDEVSDECKKCLIHQDCTKYKTIFIRPKKNPCSCH